MEQQKRVHSQLYWYPENGLVVKKKVHYYIIIKHFNVIKIVQKSPLMFQGYGHLCSKLVDMWGEYRTQKNYRNMQWSEPKQREMWISATMVSEPVWFMTHVTKTIISYNYYEGVKFGKIGKRTIVHHFWCAKMSMACNMGHKCWHAKLHHSPKFHPSNLIRYTVVPKNSM